MARTHGRDQSFQWVQLGVGQGDDPLPGDPGEEGVGALDDEGRRVALDGIGPHGAAHQAHQCCRREVVALHIAHH
jgi:hypothetical protein